MVETYVITVWYIYLHPPFKTKKQKVGSIPYMYPMEKQNSLPQIWDSNCTRCYNQGSAGNFLETNLHSWEWFSGGGKKNILHIGCLLNEVRI